MPAPGVQPELRPLGLGEVLDRAVTLCVRNFVAFGGVYSGYAIVLGVLTSYLNTGSNKILEAITPVLASHSAPDLSALLRAIPPADLQGASLWGCVWAGLVTLVGPLPTGALIATTTALYLGRPTSFRTAYRTALERWWHVVGINLLFVIAGGVFYLAFVVLLVVVFLGLAFVTAVLHGLGVAIGLVVGTLFLFATLGFFLVAVVAFQMAYFTCVAERVDFARAFLRGLSRTFSGIGLRRSLLVGLIYCAISGGIALLSGVGTLFIELLHSRVAWAGYQALIAIGVAAFTTAFMAVFYIDLRVREEGFDLQLAAEGMRASPPPASG